MRLMSVFFCLLFLFASNAFGQQQPLTCSARQYPPSTVRLEGYTELLGDMVVACTGGTPTAANTAIPFVDITLSVGVAITNRKGPSETFIDALLMVDEPHSVTNPNVPLVPCISCAPNGNGTGRGVYNGATGFPNAFQGELTGNSTIRFRVPFDPPGTGAERIVRVTNVRVNGTRLAGVIPNTVVGTLNIPGAAMSPGTQILGVAHRGLRIATTANGGYFPQDGPAEISACPQGFNFRPTIGGLEQPNHVLTIEETTVDGLRARNIGQDLYSGPAGAFGSFFTGDINQNVIGYPYGSETGVFAGSSSNPGKPVPQIGTSTPFEPVRALDRAGLATHGTRFYIRFTNAGRLSISLPVSLVFYPLPRPSLAKRNQAAPTRAILIQGDSTSSSGSFTPVIGNAKGFARIPNIGSTATAVYEVVSADASAAEWAAIPIVVDQAAVAFGSFSDNGKVMISVGLGPASDVTGPDASAPIPRFAPDNGDTVEGFVYSSLNCFPMQDVSVRVSGTATRGGTGSMTITYNNDSDSPVPGVATVDAILPPGFTATAISGSGFGCALQSLRCVINGDRLGQGFINVAYTVPANAPAIVTLSASVTATGDQSTSNNIANVQIRTLAPVSFEVSDMVGFARFPNDSLLSVDGTFARSSVQVFANPGTTVTVSTIANQYQADGSLLIFKSWSDNGSLTHGYLIPAPSSGSFVGLSALFERPQSANNPMQCVSNAGVPPLLPATEKTAPLGDLTLYCTGGIPTTAGAPVPKVDIRVSVGSVLTSRAVFPGVSEALLIVDEPHSTTNPNVPLLPCGASGSGNNANGNCFNTGAGLGTYNGSPGRPNVFQGVFDGVDSVLFSQVPFDASPGIARIFRFVNLRADVSLLPVSYSLVPSMIHVNAKISPSGGAVIQESAQVVAFLQMPIERPAITATASLPQCQSANPQIALDPSKPLETGPGNGSQATVVITEVFPSSFSSKNIAVRTGSLSYPADSKQNVPGAIFQTQTMFYAGPGPEPVLDLLVGGNTQLPPTPDFPAFRGLNLAGKADSGTRIAVRFSSIPAGVKLFVPASIGGAQLTASDAAGGGAFTRIRGNATGMAPLTVTPAGEALAVYEILVDSPFTIERLTIPIALAFAGGQPALGTIQFSAGLAPFVTAPGNATDVAGLIPRYAAAFADPRPIATIRTCDVPDSELTYTRSGPRVSGPITAQTTYTFKVTNVGRAATTRPTRLFIEATPARIVNGTGWDCLINASGVTSCERSDSLSPGASFPPVTFTVGAVSPGSDGKVTAYLFSTQDENQSNERVDDLSTIIRGGQTFIPLSTPCRLVDTRDSANGTVSRLVPRTFDLNGKCGLPTASATNAPAAYALNVTVVPKRTLGYLTIWPAGQEQPLVSTLNALDGRVKANSAIIPAGTNNNVNVFATEDTEVILDLTGYFANSGGLDFYPLNPCRVVDTRNANGPFGGPVLDPLASRNFSMALSNCVTGLPTVYSLNATVVPTGPLGFLTLSNPNLARPTVSTLNAVTGAITANALLIGGTGNDGLGRVAAFATERTHLLLDINGYFQDGTASPGLKYYPIQPCRLVDTRNAAGPYGGPALARAAERIFDFPAGGCGIPANARSFAVNATVVPAGQFGFLTIWGTGLPQPTVSTLNALDGAITSNSAIVSDSGITAQRGKISVYASDAVHLILDVNGYFAP